MTKEKTVLTLVETLINGNSIDKSEYYTGLVKRITKTDLQYFIELYDLKNVAVQLSKVDTIKAIAKQFNSNN
jgi:hypothetical protein